MSDAAWPVGPRLDQGAWSRRDGGSMQFWSSAELTSLPDPVVIVLGALLLLAWLCMSIARARSVLDQMDIMCTPGRRRDAAPTDPPASPHPKGCK